MLKVIVLDWMAADAYWPAVTHHPAAEVRSFCTRVMQTKLYHCWLRRWLAATLTAIGDDVDSAFSR